MRIEADPAIICEFIARRGGQIQAVPVWNPESLEVLYYQLVWEVLGNMPDEGVRIVIGGKYQTLEDAMDHVVEASVKNSVSQR